MFRRTGKMRLGLFLLLCILHEGASLFFMLGEKEFRCFFEDYQEDVLLKLQFNATLYEKNSHIGLVVTVSDPGPSLLLKKEYASQSIIRVRTSTAGEYRICVSTDSQKWAMYAKETVLVHFRIDADYDHDDALVGKPVKKKSKFAKKSSDDKALGDAAEEDDDADDFTFESRLNALKKDLKWIVEMQDYYRTAEEHFRGIAETINSRVLIWATAQLLLLLATGLWQMRSLKNFFIEKKLV